MPADVEIRPPRLDERGAIARLLNSHSRAMYGTDALTEAEIGRWFETPTMDPERDMRLAFDPAGTLVGYADVNDGGPERRRYWIDLRLAPGADRAAGDALVAELEGRATETAGPGALIRGFLAGPDECATAVFSARGYRLIRHSLRMEIVLDSEPDPPVWPGGITVRTARGEDSRPVFDAAQEAFEDHWEFEPQPYAEFEHWMLGGDHDPELWFLAEDGDELAGVCLCRPHDPGEPDLGWVDTLGVRRPWRRRGLGLALLRHSFGSFYARGLRRVGLSVDAENLTGAVRLYETAGMHVARRSDSYERELA